MKRINNLYLACHSQRKENLKSFIILGLVRMKMIGSWLKRTGISWWGTYFEDCKLTAASEVKRWYDMGIILQIARYL